LDSIERWIGVDAVPHFINGQELRNWKKTPIHMLVNQFGEDGWEMTGVVGSMYVFFKRPRLKKNQLVQYILGR
jgi:hypothetical protein